MIAVRFDPWTELAVGENGGCGAAPAKAANLANADAAEPVTCPGVPAAWMTGVARLRTMPRPARIRLDDWRRIVADAARFLDGWGAQAAALGWSTLDLLGCHPTHPIERIDCAGLVLLLRGDEVAAITADAARLTTPGGAHLTYYRRPRPGAVPLWQLATPLSASGWRGPPGDRACRSD